ncbi:citrulline utilization hydrolase CtlX [Ferruginibacter albus]|uniref:citrulline utilization hydrolase CtlX n=1 Tax=Ferruginibacter albus TaxID=2875540 RepID=UPI001CC51C89|nr:arginine deiminase-related protein [Ferruginibacter albus]UAY53588.1 amidinotransferase [Ferruginibacter albus]
MQYTSHILMIQPVNFGFNSETAVNNSFQTPFANATSLQQEALIEFTNFANMLNNNGINVLVIEDTYTPHTPDSIFPNNWISFHEEGNIVLYPMFAPNRRAERKKHVLEAIREEFIVNNEIDLTAYEQENLYLEGTGSMVLDRENKIAYACISPRTNKEVLRKFCEAEDYIPITFTANDDNGDPIYHTNVMMCVADAYVVICFECIPDPKEQQKVLAIILETGKEIIEVTMEQMKAFAGNMLQVINKGNERLLVMSSQAFHSLTSIQKEMLRRYNRIIHSRLNTIEKAGGGSARCMMAEIFLHTK